MGEHQTRLGFDVGHGCELAAVPGLRDEIAQAWRLPLGERVDVCFRGSQRAAISPLQETMFVTWRLSPSRTLLASLAG